MANFAAQLPGYHHRLRPPCLMRGICQAIAASLSLTIGNAVRKPHLARSTRRAWRLLCLPRLSRKASSGDFPGQRLVLNGYRLASRTAAETERAGRREKAMGDRFAASIPRPDQPER
jgi:hypothetical protein